MKNIFFAVILVLSFAAHADINTYTCELENASDRAAAQALNLPNYSQGVLSVDFAQCKLTGENANFDICRVAEHSLVIAVDPTRSVLLTPRGQTIEFNCEEFDPEEDEEQQEEEQEEQEEQQGEPGHGGSNVRMRGIRKD